MDTVRSQFDGVAESLARTREMLDESRQLLDTFYSRRIISYRKHDTMICLLCDHEAAEMNRLNFRAANRNGEYPSAALAMMLRQFGVCDPCVTRYRGKSRRVLAALNRRVAEALAA